MHCNVTSLRINVDISIQHVGLASLRDCCLVSNVGSCVVHGGSVHVWTSKRRLSPSSKIRIPCNEFSQLCLHAGWILVCLCEHVTRGKMFGCWLCWVGHLSMAGLSDCVMPFIGFSCWEQWQTTLALSWFQSVWVPLGFRVFRDSSVTVHLALSFWTNWKDIITRPGNWMLVVQRCAQCLYASVVQV